MSALLGTARLGAAALGGAPSAALVPLLLSTPPKLWLRADRGVLNGSDATPTNGQNVKTWQDQSGNGNHLTEATDGNRPSYRTADGPLSGPCLRFEQEHLGILALAASIANPTALFVGMLGTIGTTTGSDVGDYILTSDGGPVFYWQDLSATNMQFGTGASGSGSYAVPHGEWIMHRIEALQGGGEQASNDGQGRATTTLGASSIDSFAIGSNFAYSALYSVFDVAEVMIFEGALSDADQSTLRTYLRNRYGFSWSAETYLADTFTRADSTSLGAGESNHDFEGTLTSAQILSNTLTIGASGTPWANMYAYPQINFVPSVIECTVSTRTLAGVNAPVGAILITKDRQSLLNMLHFSFSRLGWTLEQFTSDGVNPPVQYVVKTRSYGAATDGGNFRIEIDWAAGTVTVTDWEGVTTECDWNGGLPIEDLSAFATPYLCFELGTSSGAEPTKCFQFDHIAATP